LVWEQRVGDGRILGANCVASVSNCFRGVGDTVCDAENVRVRGFAGYGNARRAKDESQVNPLV
jgi:hypothetical protein